MLKVWNLGNTTIRNPNRIEQGLQLFEREFQGHLSDKENEALFWKRLNDEGIVRSSNLNSDWGGRKWRNVLVKLGFATYNIYRWNGNTYSPNDLSNRFAFLNLHGFEYEVTPAGRHLLESKTTGGVQDVFLRQLIRHELPNPIENEFSDGHLKPFIFLLQILLQLKQRNEDGLNKIETALFIQPFSNHTDELVLNTIQNILNYRQQRRNFNGSVSKKNYDRSCLQNLSSVTGIKWSSPLDYADTTFRYTQMTGLLAIRGSRLVLRDNKLPIIESLLVKEPEFLTITNPLEYLADFYKGTNLPTDNVPFAVQEIIRIGQEIESYGETPKIDVQNIHTNISPQESERIRYELLEQLGWLKENEFASLQAQPDSINNILYYLELLKTSTRSSREILDPPAYLEWAVWRGFLAINHIKGPIHKTRRFQLDDDLYPRNPAPGQGPDMIFEFERYILMVEVTLTTALRQLVAEGEPVRRHVADLKENYGKDIYCLFIAPFIDNNIAETFRIGVWYREDREDFVNVVPVTLNQFKQIIEALLGYRYSPIDLQQLLDKCLAYRNVKAPEWKLIIQEETSKWVQNFFLNPLS